MNTAYIMTNAPGFLELMWYGIPYDSAKLRKGNALRRQAES